MIPEAIFFDVDGTLVSFERHQVPESARQAIATLRAKGVKTFVATGRMPSQMGILGGMSFDGYITYNGAACFDGAWNAVNSNPIPHQAIVRLLDYLETHELTVGFMFADSGCINRHDPIAVATAKECGEPTPPICDPRIALEKDVYQLNLYVDMEQEQHLMRELFEGCSSTRWHPRFCDVNAAGVNKQVGMDHILNHFAIPLSATMAFGDGGNDLPMLRHAAIGVAMGNARNEVKLIANHTTLSVDDDGIAHALSHFGLI